jgi:hypothetical protein
MCDFDGQMSYSYQMQVGKPGDNKTKPKSVADAPEPRLAVAFPNAISTSSGETCPHARHRDVSTLK